MGRGIDWAIDALEYLPQCRLVVAGVGDEYEKMKAYGASKPWAERVEFLGRVEPERLQRLTPLADVGLVMLADMGLNYRYALPNRIGDFVAAGVPMVVSDMPEMAAVVRRFGVGEVMYSSTAASRRSPSPSLGEESGVFTVDWAKLRLSIGDVPPVESPRMTMTEDNVLEITYEKGHGYSHDQVFAVVYAPGLNNSFMSYPAFRRDKHISIALPNNFAREELQVWLLVQSPDNRWSEAAYVENEELGVRNEELEEGVAYSSTTAERRSPSPTLGEEQEMQGAPPD